MERALRARFVLEATNLEFFRAPLGEGKPTVAWDGAAFGLTVAEFILLVRDGVALIQDNGLRSSFEIDLQKEAVKTVLMKAELLSAGVGCVSVLTTPAPAVLPL